MGILVSGTVGFIHLIASCAALITGLYVLSTQKGTESHKKIGYFYSANMLIVNVTAFFLYNLTGKFAIFHWFAVLSLITLFLGLYPVMFSSKKKGYLLRHFNFMYWSVVGLYCALISEVFTRLPKIVLNEAGEPMTIFYRFVGIGTGLVMAIGVFFFIKYKPIWTKQFGEIESKKKVIVHQNNNS